MTSKQIIVLAVLIIYMIVNMVVGLKVSHIEKGQKTGSFLQNYFIGGRSMGGLVLAMTLVATYTSASSFLGGPGLAADWGLTQSWVAAIQIGTACLTRGVLGKKMAIISRRINAVSITDYFKARYNSDGCSVNRRSDACGNGYRPSLLGRSGAFWSYRYFIYINRRL